MGNANGSKGSSCKACKGQTLISKQPEKLPFNALKPTHPPSDSPQTHAITSCQFPSRYVTVVGGWVGQRLVTNVTKNK